MALPYLSSGPGIGGDLKERPEDFVVREVPAYEPSGEGGHLYMRIQRKGMATREVADRLARALDVPAREIGYAGLKDKHALTTQTFSVPMAGISQEEAIDRMACLEGIYVEWARRHANKLKPGHLRGNEFSILVRGTCEDAMGKAMDIAEELASTGIANYYGTQRFGSNQDNHLRGMEILKSGSGQRTTKWERRFLLAACQSYLCNQYIALRIGKGLFGVVMKGDIAKKHDTGGIFLAETEDERAARHEISFTAPIFGYRMRQPEGLPKELEYSLLAREGLTTEEFRGARLAGSRRAGRIFTHISLEEESDGIRFKFFLPKGSFATSLMREFMKGPGL